MASILCLSRNRNNMPDLCITLTSCRTTIVAQSNLRRLFAKVYRFFHSHRPLQGVLNLDSHTQFIGTGLQLIWCVTLNYLSAPATGMISTFQSLRHRLGGLGKSFVESSLY